MEVIEVTVGTFYVLYHKEYKAFLQDSQCGYTENVLSADQYDSLSEAKKQLSYYDTDCRVNITPMKITLVMSKPN